MSTAFILAHFCSCNMGDKYQGLTLIKMLKNIANLVCVNFSDIDGNNSIEENFLGTNLTIYSPEYAFSHLPCDNLIVLTGSFDNHSPHVKWIKQCFNDDKIKTVHIWGGFHGVDENFLSTMTWIKSDKLHFYARGKDDADIFTKITGKECEPSGDPMCYYLSIFERTKETVPGKNLFIASYYLFENKPELFLSVLQKNIKTILFIDSYIDNQNLFMHFIFENKPKDCMIIHESNPLKVLDIISEHDMVYSSRLHGAILSFGLYKPTVMLVTDDSDLGEKSFKFYSVGLSGNNQLCYVTKNTISEIYERNFSHNIFGFITLSMGTFSKLSNKLI